MSEHDELVEKVARAIYEVMPHYDLDQGFAVMSWDDLVAFEEGAGYTPTITVLRDKARAAIAAMQSSAVSADAIQLLEKQNAELRAIASGVARMELIDAEDINGRIVFRFAMPGQQMFNPPKFIVDARRALGSEG